MKLTVTRFISLITCSLLVFPFPLYTYYETGIPLSDIICVIGAFALIGLIRSFEAIIVLVSIFLAILSVFFATVLEFDGASMRNLLSLIFFFKPLFAYFAGAVLIDSKEKVTLYMSTMAVMGLVLMLGVWVSIALSYGLVVRAESELNGNFFGIPLFGAFGVNSLAAFYVVIGFIAIVAYDLSKHTFVRVVSLLTFVASLALVFGSLSRMAALGAICLLFFTWKDRSIRGKVGGMIVASALIAVGGIILLESTAYDLSFKGAKINQIEKGIEEGDLDYISSGRITLLRAAIDDVRDNPLMGSYFGGYQVNRSAIDGFEIIEGLSPHNQYITAIWKMGVFGGLMYFLFLGLIFYRIRKSIDPVVRKWGTRLSIIFLMLFSLFWDVLIIPNVGALFFFIMGAFVYGGRKKIES